MTEPVEIYKQEGETPRTIRLYLDPSGNLVLGSQDFPGEAVSGFVGGATEYEYDTTVKAGDKDSLVLALLVEKYKGNPRAVEDFREWCQTRSIPCTFSTWGTGHFE